MPTPDQLEWFFKTGSIYGLGFIVIALGIFFAFWAAWLAINGCRKWVPAVVGAHVDNVKKTTETQTKLAQSFEKLTETQREMVKQSQDFRCRHP